MNSTDVLITVCFFAITSVLITLVLLRLSPEGYEDETGFHLSVSEAKSPFTYSSFVARQTKRRHAFASN
jgi:hypothetical protein